MLSNIHAQRKLGFLMVIDGPRVWKYNSDTGSVFVSVNGSQLRKPDPSLRQPDFEAIRAVCYCRQLTALSCDYCAGVRAPESRKVDSAA
jgi:hypothetical protein